MNSLSSWIERNDRVIRGFRFEWYSQCRGSESAIPVAWLSIPRFFLVSD